MRLTLRLKTLVTPHVGVWIETSSSRYVTFDNVVTPHVGVWIETQYVSLVGTIPEVTPHVGVWIETNSKHQALIRSHSHTSCRCVD